MGKERRLGSVPTFPSQPLLANMNRELERGPRRLLISNEVVEGLPSRQRSQIHSPFRYPLPSQPLFQTGLLIELFGRPHLSGRFQAKNARALAAHFGFLGIRLVDASISEVEAGRTIPHLRRAVCLTRARLPNTGKD